MRKKKNYHSSVTVFRPLNGLESLVRSGQAASQITSLARVGRTTSALPSSPAIPRIMPPVSLNCFCQFVSVSHKCISLCLMLEHKDGKTTVPSTSKESIGKKLVNYQKLPVVIFRSIDCQIP